MFFKKILPSIFCICILISCNEKKNSITSFKDSYDREIKISINLTKSPRIISIAPSMTELFFQLDNGKSLIARSDYCDYPNAAKFLPSVGSLISPNIEYILSLKPDLIVASDHFTKENVNKLEQFNIPVYIGKQGQYLDDFYKIISDMGKIIGKEQRSQILISDMKKQIHEIEERVKNKKNQPKIYYMISFGESGDYTAGKNTFIANLIRIAGGINISDDTNGWGYSREKLFAANPDIILTSNSIIKEQLKKDATYSKLRAVQNENVYLLKTGTVERPSLRNIDAILEMENIFFSK